MTAVTPHWQRTGSPVRPPAAATPVPGSGVRDRLMAAGRYAAVVLVGILALIVLLGFLWIMAVPTSAAVFTR